MRFRGPIEYALLALAIEKVAQHVFITGAFVANAFGLRESVAVDYRVLAVSGGVVAVLFALGAAGLWRRRPWALELLIGLGAFDIVGEFVAQGTVAIEVTVSFLVAVVLVVLVLLAWRVRRDAASTLARA